MTHDDALKVLEAAFPNQGVTVQRKDNTVSVVAKDGAILGKAFGLEPALRAAVRPVLEAEAIKRRDHALAAEQEFKAFFQFLRSKHDAEFRAFLEANAHPAAGNAAGAQPDTRSGTQIIVG